MPVEIYGREEYLAKIKIYAESDRVGNQAFLGVKGIGKTSLFQSYFTREKKGEIAQTYKKLFVYSQLDSRKKGTDLYQFLLDQVKMGILSIPNAEDRKEIKEEMDAINDFFETPDGRLDQYLGLIKDKGYDLIIIMDQFHCMARDSEIGKEQYDVLRSFNEQKLITYWIITDTDLMETCATKQYIASFFAQKFTNKMTIGPVDESAGKRIVDIFLEQKKVSLSEEEKNLINEVAGGVPELISILVDILPLAKNEVDELNKESLCNYALSNAGCKSLFRGWSMGLSLAQKKLLFEVAETREKGLFESDLNIEVSKMAELADEVGRGVLHVDKTGAERYWNVNIPIYRSYIVEQGEDFYLNENEDAAANKNLEAAATPNVTNIFNIEGNYIQSQTNNVINIENAVAGLEDLQRLFSSGRGLLDEGLASQKLEYLPFRQELWLEMDAEEQEEELEKYADGIFSSAIFANDELSEAQKQQFCLTDEILGGLSDSCRVQITCGIQVYNLIQLCIEKFGLDMNESESPRGILFARAFERHLKDVVAPAFYKIPQFALQQQYQSKKPVAFKDYPLDKTTIGTYVSMLSFKKQYTILADISTKTLGYTDKDVKWWKDLTKQLGLIGDLRNNCCHSGSTFDNQQLRLLIQRIFDEGALADVLLFKEI